MITAFGGGGGAFGGDSLGRGGGSGSGSTGDGGRSARWPWCDGDSPMLDGIHEASGSSSWPCSGGLLWDEARGGRSRSRALSLACATAVDRERPSTNVLLLGELLLPRPLGESAQLSSTILVRDCFAAGGTRGVVKPRTARYLRADFANVESRS